MPSEVAVKLDLTGHRSPLGTLSVVDARAGSMKQNGALAAIAALALHALHPPTRQLAVKLRLLIDFLVERIGRVSS